MKTSSRLLFTFLVILSPFYLKAQFAEPELVVAPFGALSVQADDVNQDGNLDLVLQDYQTIRWFEFDLANNFLRGQAFTLDTLYTGLSKPTIADLDGDGDTDYIVHHQKSRQIMWLEKLDTLGNLKHHIIEEYQYGANWEFQVTDLDQDGLVDIIAAKSGDFPALLQYQQTSLGEFKKVVINEEDRDFENLLIEDMDGDGDTDIVVISGHNNNRLSIFRNLDGLGGSWENIDRGDLFLSRGFKIADFNQDGIPDFAHIQCDGVFWFLGSADFQYQKIKLTDKNYCFGAIAVKDVNQDGYPDIIANNDSYSESLTMSFISNTNIDPAEEDPFGFYFETEIVTDISGTQFLVEDFDQDGFAEFIVGRQVTKLFQLNTATNKFDTGRLLTPSNYRAFSFYDFDQDQDLDFVGISDQDLFVLENIGENIFNHFPKIQLPFSELLGVADFLSTTVEMRVEDLDKDGLVEIMLLFPNESASIYTVQHENEFNFAAPKLVMDFNHTLYPTHFTDFNNDGLTDLIYGNRFNRRIEKIINNGDGTFTNPAFVVSNIIEPRALSSADIDNDGDMDVLYHDYHFYWIINEGDGMGTINSMEYIPGSSRFIAAMDIDLDGDMDFIRTYLGARNRFFFNDGNGVYDKTETAPLSAHFLTEDIDKNTAMDIISGPNILFNTNLPGDNGFSEYEVIPYVSGDYGGYNNVTLHDFNADQELDFAFQGYYGIYLVENYWNLPTFSGTAFYDVNENGLQDSLEIGLGNIAIKVKSSETTTTTFTDTLGNFKDFSLTDDDYQIETEILNNWRFTTDSIYNRTLLNRNQQTNLLFGYAPIASISTGKTTIATSIFRCNQPIQADLTVTNTGTIEGQFLVTLTYDALLKVEGATPSFTSHDATNRQLTWEIDALAPFNHQKINLKFSPVGTDFIGEPIALNSQLRLLSDPTNMLYETNYKEELRCAYDPNDKLVATTTGAARFKKDDRLLYTIRFQNTGNDTAFNVTITDTLDNFLDATSIQPVSASHPYEMSVREDVLIFDFKNILLPDSLIDFAGSNGYVQFEIDSKNTIQEGDKIYNSAAIFFDLNPPIITNTTEAEIAITTSIIDASAPSPLTIYPNPTHGFFTVENKQHSEKGIYRLYNELGQTVWHQKKNGDLLNFDITPLPDGIYYLEYVEESKQHNKQVKIVKIK